MAFTLANNVLVWLTKTGMQSSISTLHRIDQLLHVKLSNVLADSTKCWFSEDNQTATMWFKVKTDVLDVKAFSKASQNGDQCFYIQYLHIFLMDFTANFI